MPLKFDSDAAYERWVRAQEVAAGAYQPRRYAADIGGRMDSVERGLAREREYRSAQGYQAPRSERVRAAARWHTRKLAGAAGGKARRATTTAARRPIRHLARPGHRRRAGSVLRTLLAPFR